MAQAWTNWSGGIEFGPGRVEHPATEDEVVQLVRDARAQQGTIRAVGSSHSSSPLIGKLGEDLLEQVLSMDNAPRGTARRP